MQQCIKDTCCYTKPHDTNKTLVWVSTQSSRKLSSFPKVVDWFLHLRETKNILWLSQHYWFNQKSLSWMNTLSLNGECLQTSASRCMSISKSVHGQGPGWYWGKETKQQGYKAFTMLNKVEWLEQRRLTAKWIKLWTLTTGTVIQVQPDAWLPWLGLRLRQYLCHPWRKLESAACG